jgi:hypothetical protein
MTELDHLDLIIEGFQSLIDKIESWGIQPKEIQDHLDPIKEHFKLMIEMGTMMKRLMDSIGLEEIKRNFGDNSIERDLLKWAKALREGEIGIKDWEAIVGKDTKKSH